MQEFATWKYHGVLPKLEFLATERTTSEASSIYFPDCSPAAGIVAAFDFAERRHVPLAALRQS
jgi:hypothetical protein